MAKTSETPSIAFLGNYIPRQCGIATFTSDLCEAVQLQAGEGNDVFAVAMNDVPEGYPYPQQVRFEIRQSVQSDYRLAADFLNIHQVSAVCLQHEYGIYGGPSGSHVLPLLRRLRRPVVTTLHTVLTEPTDEQLYVMKEIAQRSSRLVVMADTAKQILHDVYDVPEDKAVMIPHGIPDVPFVDPNFYKDQFSVEGRKVLLTFGLLSPGKGIEYAIESLPRVVKNHPDLMYIVLGATHPHVKRESGEEYRNSLFRRVEELDLTENVRFVNRFVELRELCEYLGAADIYVTPYLGMQQIVSGTLAYALGTGKATVSTPYWYAKEMLAEGRGILTPPQDTEAMGEGICHLLDNEIERHAMRKRAYQFCRKMIWKRVAQDYLDLFAEAKEDWAEDSHAAVSVSTAGIGRSDELPEPDLRHIRILTDDTGILRNCLYSTPQRSMGYSVDDQSRGLIVTAMHWQLHHDESVIPLMQTYLGFLAHALDEESGRFRSHMTYERSFSDVLGSEDSHARALWALGMAMALCPHESQIALATRLFRHGLPAVEGFASARAWAYTIVGIHGYLRRFGGDSEIRRYRKMLAERLYEMFVNNRCDDWPWCENVVSYANAKLPHALIMSGKWAQHDEWIDAGKQALSWLLEIQTSEEGMLSIVGSDGWYIRDGKRARFDQQPIEAHALVDACIEAYHVTREQYWLDGARRAFNWFLGDNDLRTPLFDFTTAGCRDGLHPDRVNENQGAESTLAWLMSLLLMQELEMEENLGPLRTDTTNMQRPVTRAIKPSGPVLSRRGKPNASPDRDDQ